MSTLTVSNVSDGTLSIPTTYVTNGSAKAWVNFNGTGTIAERDSFNVSSLTDNGTGDYTVTFTNAFGAGDYSNTIGGNKELVLDQLATRSASSFSLITRNVAEVNADTALLCVSTHGDLA